MTDPTRAAIAFLVGTLVCERKRGGVFDYTRGRFIAMNLALGDPHILIHSVPENVHLQARVTPSIIQLRDFTDTCQLRLRIDAPSFSIFEERTGAGYSGLVQGNLVYMFEEKGKQHWNYSI